MIRKILEAIDDAGDGGELVAKIVPIDEYKGNAIARILHDAIPIIKGIAFTRTHDDWTVTAPAGTDKKAFDDVIAEARYAAEKKLS